MAVVLLLMLVLGESEPRDTVQLKNGKTLAGRVVYEDDATVVLRVKSRDKQIDRAEIESVDSASRHLRHVLSQLDAAYDDVARLLELAAFCDGNGLPGEARLLCLRVLLLEPDDEQANTLLGGKQRTSGWVIKHDGKWHPPAKLATLDNDWDGRWVLATMHYELRTNLPLEVAIDYAFLLERFYQLFYDLMARELRLHDVTERMPVQVHADDASFPEFGSGRGGYFQPDTRILFVNANHSRELRTLFHEATHQLHHMTTRRSRSSRGVIPPWLDEGLAEYMTNSIIGVHHAAMTASPGALALHHFRAHVDAEKRYKLTRMLTMDSGDFGASAHVAAKYGQAYTLVHFFLHGNGGGNRQAFFDFMRRAYEGKSSMSDVKKVIPTDMDDFEDSWHAYAERMAG